MPRTAVRDMGWVKLDDNFFSNPKVVRVSKDAKVLYLAALCYAGASLTDGLIPSGALPILAAQVGVKSTKKAVDELIRAGLWIAADDDYAIHDYLEHNTSASHVREKREQAKERMQRKRSQNVRANTTRTSQDVREPETEAETETEKNTPHTPQGGADPDADPDTDETDDLTYSDEFEAFMRVYPKRVGKGAAWRAWKKLRPSKTLQRRMAEAVKAQSTWPDWQRDNGKYIPHPSTWINQARWDDEPPQAISTIRRLVV